MRVPKQCPNVVRNISAEVSDNGGVAPASFLDTIGTIAKVAAPIVTSLL